MASFHSALMLGRRIGTYLCIQPSACGSFVESILLDIGGYRSYPETLNCGLSALGPTLGFLCFFAPRVCCNLN